MPSELLSSSFYLSLFLFSPYRDEEENIGQQEDGDDDDGDIPLEQQPSTSATADVVVDDDGNEVQTSGNKKLKKLKFSLLLSV